MQGGTDVLSQSSCEVEPVFGTAGIARGRTPDPERILTAQLAATAERLAFIDATPADAASELRALAGGRPT